jgi:hypothetical protein
MEWGNYDVVHVVTHGTRICDPEGCRGMLVAGTLESALPAGPETEAEKLKSLAETGVSYAKGVRGLVLELDLDGYLVLNADFFRKHYKERLNDTLIFLNACQSFSPVATDLVDAVQGTGSVLFGWTETVRGVDAIAAAVALYEALSEWGYPAQVALDQIGELKVGEAVPGNSAPELRLSQRPDGGDLRIRDVVTLLNPGSGQVLTASDLVSIQGIQGDGIPDAAPYMLRVDGVKPELASGMTVHVSIDGSEGEPVPLTSGQVNEQDQWTVSGMLPLGYDLEEETAVTFRAWVNLHSGGESRHEASATLTGEEPIIMGTVWEFEAVHTIGYFDGTPHTTWGATTQLTLTFATGQPPTEPHPRYVVTGGSVTFDYNHTVLSCVHSAPVVTFEANPQTVSVDSEILFDTTTDPVGYSGKVFTAGPNVQVSIVCGGIVGGTVTLPTPSRWFEIEPEEGLLVSQDRRSISGTYREEDPQTGIYHETDYTITRVQ